jgi:hypothetical protein
MSQKTICTCLIAYIDIGKDRYHKGEPLPVPDEFLSGWIRHGFVEAASDNAVVSDVSEQERKALEADANAEQDRKDAEAAAATEQAIKDREASGAAEQARKDQEAADAVEQARKDQEAADASEQARKDQEAAEAAAADQAAKVKGTKATKATT